MSHRATSWAYRQLVGGAGAKFVLVALADFADETGCCWPSQKTLAVMTSQSERAVRRHLAHLEDGLGLIRREARKSADGRVFSDYITLVADTGTFSPAANLAHGPAARFGKAGGQSRQKPPAKVAADPSIEPSSIREIGSHEPVPEKKPSSSSAQNPASPTGTGWKEKFDRDVADIEAEYAADPEARDRNLAKLRDLAKRIGNGKKTDSSKDQVTRA